jgi:hypothetical protein
MTAEEMLDKIEGLCQQHNLTFRYWQLSKGWCESREHVNMGKSPFNDNADMNIEGLSPRIPDSKWNLKYNNCWVIPIENLSDPEFQAEFEDEFHARLLYSAFLG